MRPSGEWEGPGGPLARPGRLRARRGRRPRGWRLAAAAATVGVVAGGIALSREGPSSITVDTAASAPADVRSALGLGPASPPVVTPPRAPLAASGRWVPLPPGPLSRRSAAGAVFSGREVVVWGGLHDDPAVLRGGSRDAGDPTAPTAPRDGPATRDSGPTATFAADGAALDVRTGTWRPLPAAPLSPRAPNLLVWTGAAALIWGGTTAAGPVSDGAQLDLATGGWSALAPAPLALRVGAVGAWTGAELIVWGGRAAGAGASGSEEALLQDGAAWSAGPGGGRWRPLEPPGQPVSGWTLDAVWGGQALYVWTGQGLHAYDAAGDVWAVLPAPPLTAVGDAAGVLWTGEEVLILGRFLEGSRPVGGLAYDPDLRRWRPLAHDRAAGRSGAQAVYSAGRAFVWGGREDGSAGRGVSNAVTGGVYDPRADRWFALPRFAGAANLGATLVPTGDGVIVWGGHAERGWTAPGTLHWVTATG